MTSPHAHKSSSTIAWFRLAEYVDRREKERALGMYRLLAHSVTDHAVALQLQADLLRAFDDERALGVYEEAALLYTRSERAEQALAVYEQIIAYAINLKKYAYVEPCITKGLRPINERVHLLTRCVIEILFNLDKSNRACEQCLQWACDQLVLIDGCSKTFLAKVQALDQQVHAYLVEALSRNL